MLSAQANSLYGIWGALRMGIYQSYASEDLPFVIYRVSNRHLGKLLMVLASCREYGGQGFAFLTLRTSGTIASIKELETNEGTRSFFAESVKSGSLIRGKSEKLS
jgi:RNase P/RNase MRP subunit POP5